MGLLVVVAVGCHSTAGSSGRDNLSPVESRALGFLQREVPKWSRENGCFSCHNNGDAARALFAARQLGYRIPQTALADTTAWLMRPEGWSNNKGDPGFSDQRLADIQFAASLHSTRPALPAVEPSGFRHALKSAAGRIAAAQDADGAWQIESQNAVGSPATYGTALATFMAWTTLRSAATNEAGLELASRKARDWLGRLSPANIPAAAVVILAETEESDRPEPADSLRMAEALSFLKSAQGSDGGWGPYADAPSEVYDTALALLALNKSKRKPGIPDAIIRGRTFLCRTQNADGSWPATTRPSGGNSYAQQMSTTGWATLALLATREPAP